MQSELISDYQSLFLNDTPMLDVRAPVEFRQGSFPQAENLPLMDDEDRHEIGIRYREQGRDAAVALGHERVSGHVKQTCINNWQRFINQYPGGALYCFRGGMRSRISQQWIHEAAGISYPRVEGGYKAMRRYLIGQLETAAMEIKPLILGGRTGTGKTILLKQSSHAIDLEGIYNHRGSVFGMHTTPQPGQVDAENQLSINLLKFRHQGILRLVMEDESPSIGSRRIPENLYARMQSSPIILLEVDYARRVDIIFDEYITSALSEYSKLYGEDNGFQLWSGYLLKSIDRIQKRLGSERYKMLAGLMKKAIKKHGIDGNASAHREWIYILLDQYYDPMYDYQISKKQQRIIFSGNHHEVRDFLRQRYDIPAIA